MAKRLGLFGLLIALWAFWAYGATIAPIVPENAPQLKPAGEKGVYLEATGVITERLACILKCESNGNTQALGDYLDGKPRAFGCLQFWKSTFKQYCVDSYGLGKEEDFMDCQIQKQCALKILETKNGHRHWLNCARLCQIKDDI